MLVAHDVTGQVAERFRGVPTQELGSLRCVGTPREGRLARSTGMSKAPGYERTDVTGGLLAALAVGVAVFILGTPYVLSALYRGAAQVSPVSPPTVQTRAPALQVNPLADLDALRRKEDDALTHYGWVDRTHGVVRLPIDRAMELTLQRGLPDWRKPDTARD